MLNTTSPIKLIPIKPNYNKKIKAQKADSRPKIYYQDWREWLVLNSPIMPLPRS